jgi:hypothetical protein
MATAKRASSAVRGNEIQTHDLKARSGGLSSFLSRVIAVSRFRRHTSSCPVTTVKITVGWLTWASWLRWLLRRRCQRQRHGFLLVLSWWQLVLLAVFVVAIVVDWLILLVRRRR